MTPTTPGRATVQVVGRSDREREALQRQLEAFGLRVEAFASVSARTPRPSHGCLLWDLDGAGPAWPELDGVLGEIGDGFPVVLIGRAPPLGLVVRALKAGALDVLTKPLEARELARAIDEAMARSESERLHRSHIGELRGRLARLTAREQEVFERLITGRLNKQVGAELGITERTVKAHRASILRKVSVGSVAELVMLAATLEFARQQLVERASVARRQLLGARDEPRSLSA